LLLPVLRRHPERSEGPLYFVFAVAVALAFLVVIPAGDLRLSLPLPSHFFFALTHGTRCRLPTPKINLKTEENFRLPATWSLRTSEGTPITTNPPRKNHVPAPPKTQTPCKNAHSTTNKKRTPRNRSGFIAPQAVS
jgi:hypothetical protein